MIGNGDLARILSVLDPIWRHSVAHSDSVGNVTSQHHERHIVVSCKLADSHGADTDGKSSHKDSHADAKKSPYLFHVAGIVMHLRAAAAHSCPTRCQRAPLLRFDRSITQSRRKHKSPSSTLPTQVHCAGGRQASGTMLLTLFWSKVVKNDRLGLGLVRLLVVPQIVHLQRGRLAVTRLSHWHFFGERHPGGASMISPDEPRQMFPIGTT